VTGLPKIAVLASGEGSNLQALIDRLHGRAVQIVAVGGDKPGARALQRAQAAGIPARAFPLATTPTAPRATPRSPPGCASPVPG